MPFRGAILFFILMGLAINASAINNKRKRGSALTEAQVERLTKKYEGRDCSRSRRSNDPMFCMVCNLWREAAFEPAKGKIVIAGGSVMNRVHEHHSKVCTEVWKPHQYSWTNHPHALPKKPPSIKAFKNVIKAAQAALHRKPGCTTHYYANYIHAPPWARSSKCRRCPGETVGHHIGYHCRADIDAEMTTQFAEKEADKEVACYNTGSATSGSCWPEVSPDGAKRKSGTEVEMAEAEDALKFDLDDGKYPDELYEDEEEEKPKIPPRIQQAIKIENKGST